MTGLQMLAGIELPVQPYGRLVLFYPHHQSRQSLLTHRCRFRLLQRCILMLAAAKVGRSHPLTKTALNRVQEFLFLTSESSQRVADGGSLYGRQLQQLELVNFGKLRMPVLSAARGLQG